MLEDQYRVGCRCHQHLRRTAQLRFSLFTRHPHLRVMSYASSKSRKTPAGPNESSSNEKPVKGKAGAASSPSTWEDEDATVPDITAELSKLSLDKTGQASKSRSTRRGQAIERWASIPTTLPASESKPPGQREQKEHPRTPVQHRHSPTTQKSSQAQKTKARVTSSPTLSRYGVDLGNLSGMLFILPVEC